MPRSAHMRKHVAEEAREDVLVLVRLGRCGSAKAHVHLLCSGAPKRRLRVIRQPVDERVDRAVAKPPHRLGVKFERIHRAVD